MIICKKKIVQHDSRYFALKHLRDSTEGHQCPICIVPLNDKHLEAHHVFHQEGSREWLVQEIVWLCGTHHNSYTYGTTPPSNLWSSAFGEHEQSASILHYDFRPFHLLGLWRRHRDTSRFGTAYQVMRLAEYIVREFSNDFNQSLHYAVNALASLRPKLGDLSDVLFEDTIRRSIVPFIAHPNVSAATRVEVCHQIALSLFDRGEFEGFDKWSKLAASFRVEMHEKLQLEIEMHGAFSRVRFLSSPGALGRHFDAILALEARAADKYGSAFLVNKQHRALGALKVSNTGTAEQIMSEASGALDSPERNLTSLQAWQVDKLSIPDNGVWLTLGYFSIYAEILWLRGDKNWLDLAFRILYFAEMYGITNFWAEPPRWLRKLHRLDKNAVTRSGLFYPPRAPAKSLRVLLTKLHASIDSTRC